MAVYKTGIANANQGVTLSINSTTSDFNNQILTLQNFIVSARVIDIVLDENHPYFNKVGQWNGIGAIFFELVNSLGTRSNSEFALPYDPQSKTYPLINEIVLLLKLPDQGIGNITSSTSYYYMNAMGMWNHPHHNAYPNLVTNSTLPDSQQQDYQTTEGGNVRRVEDGETEIELNSPNNPSQNNFIEEINIRSLMPFMGDVIHEGRHGQSIRLGSTSKSQSEKKNNWSEVGKNGDPIIIFRNGQSPTSNNDGWIPITENIKTDLSSIYLTSYQKLPFSIANENFVSYTTPPLSPSSFSKPQIILNSDRVILNAKSDSVIISGQTSVGISSNKSINIEAKEVYIDGRDVRLGSKDASQSVLKGDDTIELLKSLVTEISNLSTALKTIQIWPSGIPSTDPTISPVASIAETNLNRIKAQLDNLKSNFVKII
jgi:hypothetical protein